MNEMRNPTLSQTLSYSSHRALSTSNLLTASHELGLCIKIALFYSYNGFITGHHGTCR
jgi:hypothetical protein